MAAVAPPGDGVADTDVEMARMSATVSSAVKRVGSGSGRNVLLPGSPMHEEAAAAGTFDPRTASAPRELAGAGDSGDTPLPNAAPSFDAGVAAGTAAAAVRIPVSVTGAGGTHVNGAVGSTGSLGMSGEGQTPALQALTSETDLVQALTQHARESTNSLHGDAAGAGAAAAARNGGSHIAGTGAGVEAVEQKAEASMLQAEAEDTVPSLRKTPTVPILVTRDRPRKVMSKTLSWKDQHGHHLTHVCYADDLPAYGDAVYESPRDEPGCCVIL